MSSKRNREMSALKASNLKRLGEAYAKAKAEGTLKAKLPQKQVLAR